MKTNPPDQDRFRVLALWRLGDKIRMFSRLSRWVLSAFAIISVVSAANLDDVLKAALAAEARWDTPTALLLFKQADTLHPNDAVILQKVSKQYSDATSDTTDPVVKQHLAAEALVYARRAVTLEPKNPVNILSVAICYGKLAGFSDTRTKLEYSRHVKEFAEAALALKPDYDYAHHILGRWHYEVATLGVGTRFLVKLIYGGLPAASTAEAVRQLRRATELAPEKPAHRVELGLALLADGQRELARQILGQALAMPKCEKYDDESFARARAGLEKLR
ncbi:MAG: Flp pilus assembly protein TadD [Verrucomicrobia bacterium]|nr:MAG: Flp pilus assembly protein TadD [Verrucomicrobiota bacterium]